jgi:hypothetical protein
MNFFFLINLRKFFSLEYSEILRRILIFSCEYNFLKQIEYSGILRRILIFSGEYQFSPVNMIFLHK